MQGDIASLVVAASGGDQGAWDRLVERFGGLVWSIARGYGLNRSDAADVSQTAWLRLVEHLGRIREPDRVGAWLAATARHECLRVLRRSGRHVPVGDVSDIEKAADLEPDPAPLDEGILTMERDAALWRAFAMLSERCRTLLRVLMADPPPTYEEVGKALDMPVGSIGPTRGRCLERLRHHAKLVGISADASDS